MGNLPFRYSCILRQPSAIFFAAVFFVAPVFLPSPCHTEGRRAPSANESNERQTSKTKEPAQHQVYAKSKKAASLADNERGVSAVLEKKFDDAEIYFKKSLANDPQNLTAVSNLAGVYLTRKRNVDAIHLLEGYTSHFKKDPNLYVRLGDAYFGAKKLDGAFDAYQKAFVLAPQYQQLAVRMATLYSIKQDYVNAERMLEMAIAQTPNDPRVLNNLGNIYLLTGKSDKAVDAAKQALQIHVSKESYLTLGTAYESQQDYQNALIAFEKAVDLGDTRSETADKVEKLKKVTS